MLTKIARKLYFHNNCIKTLSLRWTTGSLQPRAAWWSLHWLPRWSWSRWGCCWAPEGPLHRAYEEPQRGPARSSPREQQPPVWTWCRRKAVPPASPRNHQRWLAGGSHPQEGRTETAERQSFEVNYWLINKQLWVIYIHTEMAPHINLTFLSGDSSGMTNLCLFPVKDEIGHSVTAWRCPVPLPIEKRNKR